MSKSGKSNSSFTYRNIESFGDYDFEGFYELMVKIAPPGSTLLEVGCFKGRSLCHLGTLAKQADKGLKVIGVDWGRGMGDNFSQPTANDLVQNVNRCGLSDLVQIVLSDSDIAHKMIADRSCWMVFIDGRHTPHEAVRDDVLHWLPKVQYSGVLAGHDYRWWTVCEPVNAMLGEVLHDPKWDNVWLSPMPRLNDNYDIHKPTTIPKDAHSESISEWAEFYAGASGGHDRASS